MNAMRVATLVSMSALGMILFSFDSSALTPIDRADLSPDISVTLDGSLFNDDDVTIDDLVANTVTAADLGALPSASDISAYHLLPNGDQLFSVATTVVLDSITAGPADVVRYDGSEYSIRFE